MNRIPVGKHRMAVPKWQSVKRGEFLLITTGGEERLVTMKPFPATIRTLLGAECLDMLIIDFEHAQIMVIDDTGMLDGKPINTRASEIYRSACKPGAKQSIHGDVVVANDEDLSGGDGWTS